MAFALFYLAAAPATAGGVPPSELAKTIAGLVALFALAWLAGHPTLSRFEARMKVNPFIVTGLVFVFLGVLASRPEIGILTGPVVNAIAPIVPLGLGWIGFRIGFEYDRSILEHSPPASSVLLAIVFPLLITGVCCAVLAAGVNPEALLDPTKYRDFLIYAVAASMTSVVSVTTTARLRPDLLSMERLQRFVEMEQACGIVGLMLISIYFRPPGDVAGWQLPPIAWLFVTVGVGAVMGVLAYGLFRASPEGPPFIVILLGVICMSAGMASFLRLSAIAVCFVVGIIVTNLPGAWKGHLQDVLERMGRPVFFMLLTVAGALWSPLDYRGWVLMLVFVAGRLLGKTLGFRAAERVGETDLTIQESRALAFAPVGTFAVAVIISARDLYPDSFIQVMLTAVIGGALVSEAIMRFYFSKARLES